MAPAWFPGIASDYEGQLPEEAPDVWRVYYRSVRRAESTVQGRVSGGIHREIARGNRFPCAGRL